MLVILCPIVLCIAGLPAAAQRAVGACCLSDGSCSITSEALCDEKGGTFLGLNTTCDACPPVCDDENPCTEDSWNGRACVYEPLDCDDGNPCTVDSCFMGRCNHDPIPCDDKNPCTTDSCIDGECVYETLDCDDGNPCTSDLCYMGECGHEQITCNDGDPCTTDTCVGGDCVYEPVECTDGDPCTEDSCVGGDCVYEPLDCSDGNPCATDTCEDGNCISKPLDCDDADPCTTDACRGGRCTNDPVDCDDGNDRTEDSCREGSCEHTLIQAPVGTGNEEMEPAIWFVDEAPWGENEKNLHQALCAGATLAGARLRALLYRNGDVKELERLLFDLPDDRKPRLVFCSRETIERIDPGIAGETLFYDTSSLQQLLEHGTPHVLVGLPGQRMDWTPPEADWHALGSEIQDREGEEWDATRLPDPLAWLEQLAALQPVGDESGEAPPSERVLAAFDLPEIGSCRLVFAPLEAGIENSRGPIRLCCGADCAAAASSIQMITPSAQQTGGGESSAVENESDIRRRLALWFALSAGLNTEEDETWHRIAAGHALSESEQGLADSFASWLAAIGHVRAAESVAQQMPLPDETLGYVVRFLWFREQWQQMTPGSVPWWQRWIENAANQANGESASQPVPLLLILARIDPATGELAVELLGQ